MRRTHRRSASDTDVKTSEVGSFLKNLKKVSEDPSKKIVEINEEDFVEGYKDGPSHHPALRVRNWAFVLFDLKSQPFLAVRDAKL